MQKTFVISLGGSLIFPENLDRRFLANFKKKIEEFVKKNYKFVIVCGGGKLARNFQQIASNSKKLRSDELDWIGIHATKINASLVKSIFHGMADENIASNPNSKIKFRKNIIIASGWIPGWSTDYVAVLLAKNIGASEVINMSNIDYVYDKDPQKHKNAMRIEKISWKGFSKLIGKKWKAGMNAPFDPIAAKQAQKSEIKVCVIGRNLKNLENLLEKKKFKGTVIEQC